MVRDKQWAADAAAASSDLVQLPLPGLFKRHIM